MKQRALLLSLTALACLLIPLTAGAGPADHDGGADYVIKAATLVPDGTNWAKELKALSATVEERTNGEVRFRFRFGGSMGDEPDVIRKLRSRSIQCAAISGMGLGQIVPEIRILESPLTFSTKSIDVKTDTGGTVRVLTYDFDQVDAAYEALRPTFSRTAGDNGFEILGYAEHGAIYLFSSNPIRSIEELRKARPWVWRNDHYASLLFETLEVRAKSLPVIDVYANLRKGTIDTFYNTPYLTIGMEWHVKAEYMINMPIVNGTGALIIEKTYFESLPEHHRAVIREVCAEFMDRFIGVSRQENVKALASLLGKNGVRKIDLEAGEIDRFREIGRRHRVLAATGSGETGPFYGRELLDTFESVLKGSTPAPATPSNPDTSQ
ncbi:TRAP transporter substrate-binding protein DctP [Thermodesulfobacteriota bacterium]